MTPRSKSGGAIARLAIAALALSGGARAADYFGPAPRPAPYVAPDDYPPSPPPDYPPPPYPPPVVVAPPPGPYPYFWGGQRYCWYDDAWNGPGWYFCGYAWRQGAGWGGPYGWNRWIWHGWRGWRGWDNGWRPGPGRGWVGGPDRGWGGGADRGWRGGPHGGGWR
jgi:hypothetical protein